MTITLSQEGKEHEILDMAKCREVFRDPGKRLDGAFVNSPFHVYAVETLRERFGFEKQPSKPVDLFVWNKGEPEKPYLTKIGGAPSLSRERPWPKDDYGKPYAFLGQISFVDSNNVLPATLPGDVLLIFCQGEEVDGEISLQGFYDCFDGQTGMYFEWSWSQYDDFWDRDMMREQGFRSVECEFYGSIHSSRDYFPTPETKAKLDEARVRKEVDQAYLIPAFSGTKIGGIPRFAQYGPPGYNPKTQTCEKALYIGQLSSIQATSQAPYPWCNVREPLNTEYKGDSIYAKDNKLMFGDMGDIYIFMKRNGKITWWMDCY